MTDLSLDEFTLLRLMAEVGVPLRAQYSILFFPGRPMRRARSVEDVRLTELCRGELIQEQRIQYIPPWMIDYVLADKGREAAAR